MPPQSPLSRLQRHFETLDDPRAHYRIRHRLVDMVMIAICAIICGADTWVEIEQYGLSKQSLLSAFLELPNGIPCHDTFERLFARLRPEQLQASFSSWFKDVYTMLEQAGIAIDGKALRGSSKPDESNSTIYMVSAWATESRLVLGQVKVNEKSNEITAIPELLSLLDLKDAMVTIDAIGCQKTIAEQIVVQGGDYVLPVKGNQGNLHKDIMDWFERAEEKRFSGEQYDLYATEDFEHGREESRRYWVLTDLNAIPGLREWTKVMGIGCIESKRTVSFDTKIERRYFLLSSALSAQGFAEVVRGHWGIENRLHWVLDVGFREDHCKVARGHAPENLAVLRHIALNLITQEKSIKAGTRAKRMRAGWDDQYLFRILTSHSQIKSKV
ncbi:MAG: ISAs1 family transposase [Pseudanabaena sp. SU_2_4]|nr:ISAs1 family transposase [Pseudanabaena sp. SU_2_4]